MEARDSFCFPKNTKNPNPSPIGKKFGFCCCGAPPGTRTLGPLIKRNQRATIVNFQNCVNSLFYRFIVNLCFASAAFFAPVIPSRIRYPAVPVCKKCAKMCKAKINHLKQALGFYTKPGKWAGLARKWHPQFHLFKPSIKCTSTTTISYKSKAALSMWTFLGGNT